MKPMLVSFSLVLASLLLAPFFLGLISRVKALFGGRRGQPLLQLYYDLSRLLRKGAVYSKTTTWVFRAGPVVNLAAILSALLLIPVPGFTAPVSFAGDLVLFAYLFGVARFVTVMAALDTGSSFEAMGASREVLFSGLVEPVFFLILATFVKSSGALSLSRIFTDSYAVGMQAFDPQNALLVISLFVLLLTENSRMPVDDPTTHLELTMIHEVMVLDHSGPDLAFILYGAALKLWIMSLLLAHILLPATVSSQWLALLLTVAALAAIGIAIGVIESIMARLRLDRIHQLLAGAGVLALLSFLVAG